MSPCPQAALWQLKDMGSFCGLWDQPVPQGLGPEQHREATGWLCFLTDRGYSSCWD